MIDKVFSALVPDSIVRQVHANTITLFQVVLVFMGLYLWIIGYNIIGGIFYTTGLLLDLVDGPWARRRLALGIQDNRRFGEFFDAFIDKVTFLAFSATATYLLMYLDIQSRWLLGLPYFLLWQHSIVEIVALVVRTTNYLAVWKGWDGDDAAGVVLAATNVGKRKALLQNTGTCIFFLTIFPDEAPYIPWFALISTVCWIVSMPYAVQSLKEKLPRFRQGVAWLVAN